MRLGSAGGLGRKRMWANGIEKGGGELVVEDAGGESVSPSPSYSFTDSNRECACSLPYAGHFMYFFQ